MFLIHIVGDMAQPMHTGRAGDLGGNKIDVIYFGKRPIFTVFGIVI